MSSDGLTRHDAGAARAAPELLEELGGSWHDVVGQRRAVDARRVRDGAARDADRARHEPPVALDGAHPGLDHQSRRARGEGHRRARDRHRTDSAATKSQPARERRMRVAATARRDALPSGVRRGAVALCSRSSVDRASLDAAYRRDRSSLTAVVVGSRRRAGRAPAGRGAALAQRSRRGVGARRSARAAEPAAGRGRGDPHDAAPATRSRCSRPTATAGRSRLGRRAPRSRRPPTASTTSCATATCS